MDMALLRYGNEFDQRPPERTAERQSLQCPTEDVPQTASPRHERNSTQHYVASREGSRFRVAHASSDVLESAGPDTRSIGRHSKRPVPGLLLEEWHRPHSLLLHGRRAEGSLLRYRNAHNGYSGQVSALSANPSPI